MASCPACGASVDSLEGTCEECGAAVGETVAERGFRAWLTGFNAKLRLSTFRMELALLNVPFMVGAIALMRFIPYSVYSWLGMDGRLLTLFVFWVVYNGVLVWWYGRREHGVLFPD